MRKITLLFTLLFACVVVFGQSKVDEKKLKQAETEAMFDKAPINKYIGKQILPSRADLLSESFENAGAAPAGWAVADVSGTLGDVTFVTSSTYPSGFNPTLGTYMARFNSYSCSSGNSTHLYQTTSFASTGYVDVTVNFDWLRDDGYSGNNDRVEIRYSTDGSTWTTAGSVSRYQASGDAWTAQSITLDAGANNQANLYISFLFISAYGNNMHLDNVVITADPVVANDLAVTNWVAPINGSDINSAETIEIEVTNNGTADKSNFGIAYSIDGGASFVNETVTSTILAGATETYAFTTTANMGVYTDYYCVAAVDLAGDENTTNDTMFTIITKSIPTFIDTLYPQALPLWTGTVSADSIIDSSYVVTLAPDSLHGWMKFDITTLPDDAIISNVQLNAYVNADNFAYFKVMSLEQDPVNNIPDSIFVDAANGNTYYTYTSNFPNPGWFSNNLSSQAVTDLQNNLSNNWFGVGLWEYEAGSFYLEYDGWNETNVPFIVVEYGMPLAIDAELTEITAPVTGYDPGSHVSITVKNNGTTPITEIPVTYIFEGDTVSETTPVGVVLNFGETLSYTFAQTIDASTPSVYTIDAMVEYTGDINPANDQISSFFTTWAPFNNLAFSYDMSNAAYVSNYGPIFQNGQFYISRWNQPQMYVFNADGTYDTTLVVNTLTAGTGFRDLGGDGDSIYGSTNSTLLRESFIENDTVKVINSMTVATAARGVEYDPINDAVWICNWNTGTENLLLVDKNTGATLQTIINPNAGTYGIGGLAYDQWTSGGPYLVGFSQHNNGNQLVWIKISDGTVLVDHDVTQDIPEVIGSGTSAGGAYVSDEVRPGSVILGGIIQNFRLFGYELVSSNFSAYEFPGQAESTIDVENKTIAVQFPFDATLTGLAPIFELADFEGIATAYMDGVAQTSGVETFDVEDGDTLNYFISRPNFDGSDSVYSEWMVIISVLDAPVAVTNAATSVQETSAVLNGEIMPMGIDITNIHFEYGTTTAYGSTIDPATTTASGTGTVPFDVLLEGLAESTTYHFRITGLANSTTIYGDDMQFTTGTYTLDVTPASQDVTSDAGSVDFAVTANQGWTAVSDVAWCTVTTSGTGDGTITATYEANPTTAERTATITVTGEFNLEVEVTVVQEAWDAYTVEFGVENGVGGSVVAELGSVGGTPITSGDLVAAGSDIYFTATPETNYVIADWLYNGASTAITDPTVWEENLSGDITVYVVFAPIGINETEGKAVQLYPNPTTGLFFIEIEGEYDVKVMNVNGEVVYNGKFVDKGEINLSNQAAGVYMIQLSNNNQIINHRIMVK